MISVRSCLKITFLIVCSINLTSGKEPERDLLLNEEDLQNLVDNLRPRRHTDALDIYQQPYNPTLHKRKRGFLSNLKAKILSFITRKNKKNQRPSIPDEVIDDETTNNLEESHETDSKIQDTTSITTMKTDKNLNNADLVAHLRKMLKKYENTLKNLKKSKPHHKKYKKHNVTMNSLEYHENMKRKKRLSQKKYKLKTKSRHSHTIIDNKLTTELPSTFLSTGSHAENHHPKNYNNLEETKKRDRILKSILRLGSHKKHYESTKPIDKISSNEETNNIIKQYNHKDSKYSVYINSNEKNNQNKDSKPKDPKSSAYINSNEKIINHIGETVHKESKTSHRISSIEKTNNQNKESKDSKFLWYERSKEQPNNHMKEFIRDSKKSNYLGSNEKPKTEMKGYKRKDLKSSGCIHSNEITNNEIQEFEHKDSKPTNYLISNEKTNIKTEGSKLKNSAYINSNEKHITQVKELKHKGDSFSHEHLENSI